VPEAGQPSGYRVWLPAIFADGEFYLFDMALGLPIPGPGGEGIATLAQVREQPELLQPMATEEFPYRLKPDDLETVTALVVADEQALSKRMLAVESHLAGDERLLLTVPSEELVDRLKQSDQVSGVLLWQRPFAIAAERIAPIPPASQQAVAEQMRPFEFNVPGRAVNPLWAGRLLQFRGEFDGKEGARAELLAAREAIQIASQLPDPNQFTAEQIQVILAARLIATDWLAHISFETEQYDNAAEFFGPRLMMAFRSIRPTESNAMYGELLRSIQASARYNYGRSFEAAERIPEAVFNYDVDHSPNRPASLLRRQRLMASLSEDDRAELERQVKQLRQQMETLQSGGDQPGGE